MPRVCQTYIYLSGFNDRDISEKGLEALDAVFQAHLDLGLRMQPRFLYPKTRDDPVNDAPQDVILRPYRAAGAGSPEMEPRGAVFPGLLRGGMGRMVRRKSIRWIAA